MAEEGGGSLTFSHPITTLPREVVALHTDNPRALEAAGSELCPGQWGCPYNIRRIGNHVPFPVRTFLIRESPDVEKQDEDVFKLIINGREFADVTRKEGADESVRGLTYIDFFQVIGGATKCMLLNRTSEQVSIHVDYESKQNAPDVIPAVRIFAACGEEDEEDGGDNLQSRKEQVIAARSSQDEGYWFHHLVFDSGMIFETQLDFLHKEHEYLVRRMAQMSEGDGVKFTIRSMDLYYVVAQYKWAGTAKKTDNGYLILSSGDTNEKKWKVFIRNLKDVIAKLEELKEVYEEEHIEGAEYPESEVTVVLGDELQHVIYEI